MALKREPNDDLGRVLAKNRRTVSAEELEKFAVGAIISIKVKNFVTYASTEFILSPSLNMIIGPNGTGKSTFVCAVCLGLAGHPTLLGRQKVLAHFIKNGEESATIEVTLKSKAGEPNLIITREIYQNNKSDWQVNNRPSNEQKVKGLLANLNVQLDNLCQFLPQEKVADFAKLTQEQLLEETERAVDLTLLEQHKALITLDKEKTDITQSYTSLKTEEEKLMQDKERFEEEAKKYEAFQKKTSELEVHMKLLPYAKIQDTKIQAQQYKKTRDELRKKVQEYQNFAAPFEDAVNVFETDIERYINQLHDKKSQKDSILNEIRSLHESLEQRDNNHELFSGRVARLKALNQQAQVVLDEYLVKLYEAHEQKASLADYSEDDFSEYKNRRDYLLGKINKVEEQMLDKHDSLGRNKRRQEKIRLHISEIEKNLKSKDRLHLLDHITGFQRKQANSVKAAIKCLRSELQGFRGKVFEPPCITITTTKPEYASYLEELVDTQTTFALTATSKEVYNNISDELFNKRKINSPFRYIGNRQLDTRLSNEQLKSLGFEGFLRDFVVGPAPVVRMLCEQSFIHDVPVSIRPLTDEQISRLQTPVNGSLIFRKFFSGDVLYTLSISQYGSRQVSIRTSQVSLRPRFFGASGLSDERKKELMRKLAESKEELLQYEKNLEPVREDLSSLNSEKAGLEQQSHELNSQIKNIVAIKSQHSRVDMRITQLNEKIEKCKTEISKDHSADIIKYRNRLLSNAAKKVEELIRIIDLQEELTSISKDITRTEIKKFELVNKKQSVKNLMKRFADEKEKLSVAYDDAKRKYKEFKNSDLRRRLIAETANFTPEEKEKLANLINRYTSEGKFSENEIHDMIDSIKAELKLLGTSSRSSINTLKAIEERLEYLDTNIPDLELRIKQKTHEISQIHQDWEPKLMSMARNISDKFSSIFPSVGSAGEVKITKHENFANWRMQILVKFRDEAELKALDSHTQSGGERAVSTVLYMISMQELTASPFRVVDEINQGMDARNEKIVHKHMVETACQEHTSQYFLITPKLLTNLYYAANMRVHCIMAGPWMPNPVENPDYLSLGTTSLYT